MHRCAPTSLTLFVIYHMRSSDATVQRELWVGSSSSPHVHRHPVSDGNHSTPVRTVTIIMATITTTTIITTTTTMTIMKLPGLPTILHLRRLPHFDCGLCNSCGD